MPISILDLQPDTNYTVTRVGDTKPTMTGKLIGRDTDPHTHPYGPSFSVPAARIWNAAGEVGVYNDKYTFELADPGKAASDTPAGTGLNAVRALRKEVGRGRKTRKHKRRARKTRRRHK
jgi:hypothetical protein